MFSIFGVKSKYLWKHNSKQILDEIFFKLLKTMAQFLLKFFVLVKILLGTAQDIICNVASLILASNIYRKILVLKSLVAYL